MNTIVPYRYAELKMGKRWYVYYYAINPANELLTRKRVYIDHIKLSSREKYANTLIKAINDKLDRGWNPFAESRPVKFYIPIRDALSFALEYKLKIIRHTSKSNYLTRIKVLLQWLGPKAAKFIDTFTDQTALDFMNYLLLKRNIKGRTFNNYLVDYRSFFNLLVKQHYLSRNPFHAVDPLPETQKARNAFSARDLEVYIKHLKENDPAFFVISGLCYYCAIRPTEICRLKVSDVDMKARRIIVPPESSKNKRGRVVGIPEVFADPLSDYIGHAPGKYFLCGKGLIPSEIHTIRQRIDERFKTISHYLKLSKKVTFYSLKDTSAKKLLQAGYTVQDLRDLFGHSNISVTDNYLKTLVGAVNENLMKNFPGL